MFSQVRIDDDVLQIDIHITQYYSLHPINYEQVQN